MKDYTLSEIQKICKNRVEHIKNSCKECEMRINHICNNHTLPIGWQIDKRDMIDLPCKLPLDKELFPSVWIVMYYKKTGAFGFRLYNNEAQADAVLAGLKEDKLKLGKREVVKMEVPPDVAAEKMLLNNTSNPLTNEQIEFDWPEKNRRKR